MPFKLFMLCGLLKLLVRCFFVFELLITVFYDIVQVT